MTKYDNLQASHNNLKLSNYKGIPIFSYTGLHDKCMLKILDLNLEKDIKILILGSGAGAFDQRLFDYGFKNITSIDISKINYLASCKDDIDFIEKDLNKNFYQDFDFKFDLIVAIEIIEHLESPANFLENISKLILDSGNILITTPNVDSSFSRVRFMISGSLQGFSLLDLQTNWHISPIFFHILVFFINQNSLYIKSKEFNKNVWDSEFETASFFKKIALIFLWIVSRFMKNINDGEGYILILSKKYEK